MKLKLLITCMIVIVFCFICYELTYYRSMYEEVQRAYNSLEIMENVVDILTERNLKMQNHIIYLVENK